MVNTTTNFVCKLEPEVEITSLLVLTMRDRVVNYHYPYAEKVYPIPGTCTFETPPVIGLEAIKKAELDYQKTYEKRREEEIKKEEERLERERQRERERKQQEQERLERRQQRERERQERERARQRKRQEQEQARKQEQEARAQLYRHMKQKYGW